MQANLFFQTGSDTEWFLTLTLQGSMIVWNSLFISFILGRSMLYLKKSSEFKPVTFSDFFLP